jgi:hypothetical protein
VATSSAELPRAADHGVRGGDRLATETKAAPKTTELYAYVVVLVGLLIAGLVTKAGDGHDDRLQADQVWLYAVILTFGYMVARGLAKSGSRDPYWNDSGQNRSRDGASNSR